MNHYKCANQFPGRYCNRPQAGLCPINPWHIRTAPDIYRGCTNCLTYSSIPTECPCPGLPGCHQAPASRHANEDIYVNNGQPCNCRRKHVGLLPCPKCPKYQFLATYAGLPPPSQLVPGYLNQGSDGNFKTRWLNVSWGDLLGCSNKFHMKGLKLKENLVRHKDCDDLCNCCCNNLNRGERLRIICNGKRIRGAGDKLLYSQAMDRMGPSKCSVCNCFNVPTRPIVRNCCPSC